MIHPPIKRVGGKRSVLSRIDPYLPAKCDNYFEPFFGGGAMFFHLAGNDRIDGRAYLSDADPGLNLFYLQLMNHPDAVLDEYEALVMFNSRDQFYEVRGQYNQPTPQDPNIRAAQYLYINTCGFNGIWRTNAKGLCNVPYGGDGRRARPADEIRIAVRMLRSKSDTPPLRSKFNELCPRWPDPSFGDLVYCDPPYTGTFDGYTKEGWDGEDDARLLAKCKEWRMNGAYVVVSTADPDPYRDTFDVEPIHTSSKIKAKPRTEYVCYTGDA